MKKQLSNQLSNQLIKPKLVNYGSSSHCIDLNHDIKRYFIMRGIRRLRADCVCQTCGFVWREEYILMYRVEKSIV